MKETKNLQFWGNKDILSLHKTAFLCSRKCSSDVVLKSLDWARIQKEEGNCIISGFHSRIEKDVFDLLLMGDQPVILVLARGMKKRWPEKIKRAVQRKRLLIISPFDEMVTYITQETANTRNEIITNIADEILLAYVSENGNLYELVRNLNDKKIITFG